MKITANDEVELESVGLYSERSGPNQRLSFYLRLVYIVTTGLKKKRVIFPKVPLFICQDRLPTIDTEYDPVPKDCVFASGFEERCIINLGFGDISFYRHISETSPDARIYYEEEIAEEIHEFTIAELEQILGGKIRIVKEKS